MVEYLHKLNQQSPTDFEFGFRAKFSTEPLFDATENIRSGTYHNKMVATAFVDQKRLTQYETFLRKFEDYQFDRTAIALIKSYDRPNSKDNS